MNIEKRKALALQFIVITFLIFTGLFGAGLLVFTSELNNSLDEQLDNLVSELSDEVIESDGKIHLDKPRRFTKKQPLGRLARIELFDSQGRFLEHHGVPGARKLIAEDKEIQEANVNLRSTFMVLTSDRDKKLGYLQVQLPTTLRDRAIRKYMITMGIISIFGLFILSITGFILSKIWVKPLTSSYNILKQFTEDATHELKTPLATIEACGDNMEEEYKEDKNLGARLAVIKRSTGRMNKLVEDLILLIQLGNPSLTSGFTTFQSLSINRLVHQVLDDFEFRLMEKQIAVETDLGDKLQLNGEESKLRRLLDNLLENALRYTDNGGSIKIFARARGNYLNLKITDTGIGIPEESLAKIFDRFYRVDKARSRAQGGVGLGLAIVKGIVDMHQGNISIQSEVDKGTTISVTLPMGSSGI